MTHVDVSSPGVSVWSRIDDIRSRWDGVRRRPTSSATLSSWTPLPRLLTSGTPGLRLGRQLILAAAVFSGRLELILLLLRWLVLLGRRRPNKLTHTTSCSAFTPRWAGHLNTEPCYRSILSRRLGWTSRHRTWLQIHPLTFVGLDASTQKIATDPSSHSATVPNQWREQSNQQRFHLLSTQWATLKPSSSLTASTLSGFEVFYKNALYKFTVTPDRSRWNRDLGRPCIIWNTQSGQVSNVWT